MEISEISRISNISDEFKDSETVHAGKGVLEDRWERARIGRGGGSVREAAAGLSPMYPMTASSLGSISCLF